MAEPASLTERLVAAAGTVSGWFSSPAGQRFKRGSSIALSLLILAVLARAIADIGWDEIIAVVPRTALFWILFVASYLLPPLVDWSIYHRWWRFGPRVIAVFLKRRVLNETISYAGDTYLLAWACDFLGIKFDPDAPVKPIMGRGDGPGLDPRNSPFAAIKDVAIVSGLAGNLATLIMLLVAYAFGRDQIVDSQIDPGLVRPLLLVFAGFIVLNIAIVVFRNRVMSLPTRDNIGTFWWHMLRVVLGQVLIVATWIIALPEIPATTWMLLGALRMVIQRMPLPNKEVLFAAIAAALTGAASIEVAALMAAQGALQLVFHGIAWIAAAGIEASGPLSPKPAAH